MIAACRTFERDVAEFEIPLTAQEMHLYKEALNRWRLPHDSHDTNLSFVRSSQGSLADYPKDVSDHVHQLATNR
jgi:hypothetical protein